MVAELKTHAVAANSPILTVGRGGTHPAGQSPDSAQSLHAPIPTGPLTEQQQKAVADCKQINPACGQMPDRVIAQIHDAVSNQIAAAPLRVRTKLQAKRMQIVSNALNAAMSAAHQIKPNGNDCPNWAAVVSSGITAAIKHAEAEHHKEDAAHAHEDPHTSPSHHQTSTHTPVLAEDGTSSGVNLEDAALVGGVVVGGALLAGAAPAIAGAAATKGTVITGAAAAKTAIASAGLGKLAIGAPIAVGFAGYSHPADRNDGTQMRNLIRGRDGQPPLHAANAPDERMERLIASGEIHDTHHHQDRLEEDRQKALQDEGIGMPS